MRKLLTSVILLLSVASLTAQARDSDIKLLGFESRSTGSVTGRADPDKPGFYYAEAPRIREKKVESGVLVITVANIFANCAQKFEGSIEVKSGILNLKYIEKEMNWKEMMLCKGQHNLIYKIEGIKDIDRYKFQLNGEDIDSSIKYTDGIRTATAPHQ
ncbi:MAG: hypothetical protein WC532_04075 [Candidatus Omnitrophota bacterium]